MKPTLSLEFVMVMMAWKLQPETSCSQSNTIVMTHDATWHTEPTKKHTKPEQIAILSHIEHGGFALLEVIGSKERLKFQQLHNNVSTANVPSPVSMLETQGMTESASKNRGCVEIMSRKRSKAQSCQCFHLFKLVL
ncbi:hypothetical protein KIW84_073116 [Lathyrus oleraceus]|uniref:Uncharacterized protein n=1 Tax=Pisum sativum TaxID=3888 RepID=A0A9D4VMS9_PEA|nr:hypothetical protein KIW84_073116 [Pisum sativum]